VRRISAGIESLGAGSTAPRTADPARLTAASGSARGSTYAPSMRTAASGAARRMSAAARAAKKLVVRPDAALIRARLRWPT
jgi:hypothetical protein